MSVKYCLNHKEMGKDGQRIGAMGHGLNAVDGKFNISRNTPYSDFTNGMSLKEQKRYIANSEAKFYGEFSERAGASGLNSKQIEKAYKAMKKGDYNKMASYFDTSSPDNGAVFWSGNKEGI